MAGKKGRSGAPKGNTNALRNASRVERLIIGNLPDRLARVQRYARQYRRSLERCVSETHGEVSTLHAHYIDAGVQHEQHCMICRWLLRERLEQMETGDIIACSREMSKAKDARNRAIEKLQLDRDTTADLIATLYSKEPEE